MDPLLMTDAERLDWAESHPLEFLDAVLGKCHDAADDLKVYAVNSKMRWDMRDAIDRAASATNGPSAHECGEVGRCDACSASFYDPGDIGKPCTCHYCRGTVRA